MARDASDALAILSKQPMDVVLVDVKMPGINGLELVRQIHELDADLPCIVITGYSSAENSVEAMRAGAYWYLEKPFEQERLEVVRSLVEQAIEHGRLKAENRILQGQLRARYKFDSIVGKSGELQRVLEVVEKVADTDATVLITGETGTGKELVARAIHSQSKRKNQALVSVNCAAFADNLIESELFGHELGAFTGALQMKKGLIEAANEGTLFLDEIGELSMDAQARLLCVLQENEIRRVGSNKVIKINVRVLAATHKNLRQMVEDGSFREDLYYRINVFEINLPPLRERGSDIKLLADIILTKMSQRIHRKSMVYGESAYKQLLAYHWPGNVRELENLVERMVTLSSSHSIAASDLPNALQESSAVPPAAPQIPPQGLSFRDVVDQFESDLILQALEITHGNKNRAAQLIQMNRTTMLEKMKKKGVKFDGGSRDSRETNGGARTRAKQPGGSARVTGPGHPPGAEDSLDSEF